MSTPFGEIKDFIENTQFNDMITLDYGNDFDILDIIKLLPDNNPNNKDLRLALDLTNEMYPLYNKMEVESKVDFLKDIFKMNVSKQRLKRLNSHKKLLFKCVITTNNKNQIIIKRVRKQ